PRAGLLYAESGNAAASLTLQDDDISGGVLEAALSPRALACGTDELCYIAGFYDTHRLLTLDLSMRKTSHKEGLASETKASAMAAPALEAVPQTSFAAQPEEKLTPTDKPDSSESAHAHASAAQDYNPFRYMKNGIFLPLMTSVVTYDEKLKPSVNVDYFLGIPTSLSYIGASFLTSNPWGDHTLLVSAGSDWEDGGGANLSFSGGNQSFSYSFSATVVGNKSAGFLQTSEVLSLSKTLYARYGRSLSLGATGTGMYGYGVSFDDDSDLVHTEDKDFLGNATGFVRFSTVHKCAPGYFQYAGIFVQPFAFTERTDGRCTNAGASVGARIPGLFPLTLTASLFPTSEYCAEGSVSAVLFSHEIQHAIPGFYFDRVYLSLGYSGKLAYESDEYFDVRRSQDIFRNATMDDWTDRASLTAGMFTSINIGAASYVEFQLTASLLYYPHPEADKNRLGATFGAVLVY
ncbi:MAG: hypothetical protein K6G80_06110, partial [Treponema sp.]|nr:hypothetical protein [Treponema sp.]